MSRHRKTKDLVNSLKYLGWPSHVIASFSDEQSAYLINNAIEAPDGRIRRSDIQRMLAQKEGANEAPSNVGDNNDNSSV